MSVPTYFLKRRALWCFLVWISLLISSCLAEFGMGVLRGMLVEVQGKSPGAVLAGFEVSWQRGKGIRLRQVGTDSLPFTSLIGNLSSGDRQFLS